MASGDSATSVRILNENVDKLTKLPDMVKAFEELTNEEVNVIAVIVCDSLLSAVCACIIGCVDGEISLGCRAMPIKCALVYFSLSFTCLCRRL